MSVSLLDVWRAARARSVPFSGESAGYVALALCEATAHSPRSLNLVDAELGEEGAIRLLSNRSCPEAQADKELRTLLGRLLEVASSPGPSLFRVAGKGGGASLGSLADELEKALIPLNRAAARRALVRLFRETARAMEQGKLAPAPDLDEPAQIRLSPPAPAVGPPPAPVLPVVAPVPVVAAARVPTPLPAPVNVEPSPLVREVEHLTSAETVVARRARGLRTPPPLPVQSRSESTPRIGSVDEAVISVPSLPRQQLLSEALGDATERVPEVAEISSDDFDLQALSEWPVPARGVPQAAPQFVGELDLPLPRFACDPEFSPDPPTVEPPALRESPALVVGVHVADSDDVAEAVADDELETRPLPSSLGSLPVEPVRHLLAPESSVDELLSEFQVRDGLSETELRRELKALAGVDLTPGSALGVVPR